MVDIVITISALESAPLSRMSNKFSQGMCFDGAVDSGSLACLAALLGINLLIFYLYSIVE